MKTLRKVLGFTFGVFAIALLAAVFLQRVPVSYDPGASVKPDGILGPIYATGWIADPEGAEASAKASKFHGFADTPAGHLPAADLPKSVFSWKVYEQLPIGKAPIRNQGAVGSCVAHGTNTAVERTLATQIVIGKTRQEFYQISEEATYGGGRIEAGKAAGVRFNPSSDGSFGWLSKDFVLKYGCIPKDVYGSTDLREYDERRCREWGARGVPDELEPIARKNPVKSAVRVTTWDEFVRCCAQGYFVAISSDQGFGMNRDSRGVAPAQGTWHHCMAGDGYYTDEQGREFGHIANSWGANAHRGPTGPGNPGTDGFYVERRVIERMLAQGDSWAFSGVEGFPSRKVDWFAIMAPKVDMKPWANRLALNQR